MPFPGLVAGLMADLDRLEACLSLN